MDEPVRESIKQVDANTLLVGPLKLHRSKGFSDTSTWYDQDDDLSYTLTDAPVPPPPTSPLPLAANDSIKLVYDAGDSSAVWSIGNSAFCKVKLCVAGITPEAATLAFVHSQQPYFDIPKVLHETEHNGRSYLFLSRVQGRTLGDAWPTLDEKWRHHYMNAIVDVCKFLEKREYNMLCGVDGKNVFETHLVKYGAKEDYSPGNLQQACESMGMDCSTFVFYHADLGPGNIIVEDTPKTGSVGIIDWEVAGYFPRGWIRTKFRISRGLNLPDSATDHPTEWRAGVQELLGDHGFEHYASQWVSWCG
ncbi:unnamed protein product [Penicillium salamii]|uniref:Aminoglycoside phosphotransferase domain-containing protein n=1 Tax=Penicillium salamii TaxID=1612424 RepID=A0A9W4NHT2_9EURO|nr:unnamed protein product [Penicillium salamii]CAG8011767.1 unnamed protein product [Penicillium salamii]CAG8020392.1 unnamed protein product [Penicillium salamii]CAG8121315.1 unnamed protein product [Penicillium salamii]CAG8147017.1 unnamed protein product [Penicillium salamii]